MKQPKQRGSSRCLLVVAGVLFLAVFFLFDMAAFKRGGYAANEIQQSPVQLLLLANADQPTDQALQGKTIALEPSITKAEAASEAEITRRMTATPAARSTTQEEAQQSLPTDSKASGEVVSASVQTTRNNIDDNIGSSGAGFFSIQTDSPRFPTMELLPSQQESSKEEEEEEKAFDTATREMKIVPIPRVKAGDLSVRDLFNFQGKGGTLPVIVEGEVSQHLASKMTFQDLKALCGDGLTQTSVFNPDVHAWAGLDDVKVVPMKDYLDQHILAPQQHTNTTEDEGEGDLQGDLVYSSGAVGIPEFCPRLEFFTPIPKYVSLSLIPLTSYNVQPGQPEMYIGPPGTKTELHMDMFLIPFWMSVYKGKKTFRVIPFDQIYNNEVLKTFFLDESTGSRWEKKVSYDEATGKAIYKELEIWNPDLDVFPELLEATVYEGTASEGDWIYLPGAALHGVSNDGYSWGVSVNSLFPDTVDLFADVCEKSDFDYGCVNYAVMASLACRKVGAAALTSSEAIRSCLRSDEALQGINATYSAGGSKEMYMHEVFAFPNYEEWCEANCQLLRDRDKSFLEQVRQEGFGEWEGVGKDLETLERYYNQTGQSFELGEHIPTMQVEYACAQCKPSSDLEKALYNIN
jgi:hypothetical protein